MSPRLTSHICKKVDQLWRPLRPLIACRLATNEEAAKWYRAAARSKESAVIQPTVSAPRVPDDPSGRKIYLELRSIQSKRTLSCPQFGLGPFRNYSDVSVAATRARVCVCVQELHRVCVPARTRAPSQPRLCRCVHPYLSCFWYQTHTHTHTHVVGEPPAGSVGEKLKRNVPRSPLDIALRTTTTTNGIASPGRCLWCRPTWQLFVFLARRRTQCRRWSTSYVSRRYSRFLLLFHAVVIVAAPRRARVSAAAGKFHDAVTHVIRAGWTSIAIVFQ